MLQLHSASDDAISYIQSFAQKRKHRNQHNNHDHHNKKDAFLGDDLHTRINHLEQKIVAYETHKDNAMDKILELLVCV